MQLGIALQIPRQRGRTGKGQLDSFGLGQRPQPQLVGGYGLVPPLVDQWLVRSEHQVAVDDKAYRQARTAGQGGLDIEVTAGDLLANLVDAVLCAVPTGDDDAINVLAVFGRGQFNAYAQ